MKRMLARLFSVTTLALGCGGGKGGAGGDASGGAAGTMPSGGTGGSASGGGGGNSGGGGGTTGTGGAGGEAAPTGSTSLSVAAATGGIVKLGDASLFIPPGALPADRTITMAIVPSAGLPETATLASAVYDLTPDGLRFNKKATLTLPLSRAVPADKQAELSWIDTGSTNWTPLTSTASANQAVAETDHFTRFAVRLVPKLATPTGRMLINGSVSDLKIYEINLAGGQATSRVNGRGPCLTNEGTVILEILDLVETTLDGAQKRVIVKYDTDNLSTRHDKSFENPQVSPEGARVAYISRESLFVVNRASGDLVASFLVQATSEAYERPTWTPDGRVVVAGGFANPGLHITDAALKTITRFDPMMDRPRRPAVSPDGKTVAFELANHISLINIDGTGIRQFTTSSFDEKFPFWSPDGKWLAMYGNFSVIAIPTTAPAPVDVKSPDNYDVLKKHPGGAYGGSHQSSWR